MPSSGSVALSTALGESRGAVRSSSTSVGATVGPRLPGAAPLPLSQANRSVPLSGPRMQKESRSSPTSAPCRCAREVGPKVSAVQAPGWSWMGCRMGRFSETLVARISSAVGVTSVPSKAASTDGSRSCTCQVPAPVRLRAESSRPKSRSSPARTTEVSSRPERSNCTKPIRRAVASEPTQTKASSRWLTEAPTAAQPAERTGARSTCEKVVKW